MRPSIILNPFQNERGGLFFKSIIFVLILIALIIVGSRIGKPYYAYKALERAMQYWAEMTLTPSSFDRASFTHNVMEKVKKHNIPLKEGDIKIYYDRSKNTLSVQAEYYVDVTLPGYSHRFHFLPKAKARAVAQ